MKRIAIIGSGISGLSAAWALRDTADITVFEADSRPGGHAHTVGIEHSGQRLNVDVGFIVCNPLNYPNFMNFMQALGVETDASDMSFAVSSPNGYEWSSNPSGLFAQKQNLFDLLYIRMLLDILRFNKLSRADLTAGCIPASMTLGAYLDKLGMNRRFRENYILPMGAAIWSTPEAQMEAYPALAFLEFFNNHRLLQTERPQWRTVSGGSQSYVQKLVETLGERLRLSTPVFQIDRSGEQLSLHHGLGNELFDDVILACHAPQSYKLLGDGLEHQASILAPVETISNTAYLHCDTAYMPKRKAAWASWNVMKGKQSRISLTYWMNKLQTLDPSRPVFVTLNPHTPPRADQTFGTFEFDHPLFNAVSTVAVAHLNRINGRHGVWFAGAWMGHGFHEDGLKSGLSAALSLGGEIPWEPVDVKIVDPRETDLLVRSPMNIAAAQ